MLTLWTGFAGVVFIHHDQLYSFGFGFILNQLLDLTMIPTANLLIRLFAKVHFVANVANVAHRNGVRLTFDGDVDNRATDLVLHIADDRTMMRLSFGTWYEPTS